MKRTIKFKLSTNSIDAAIEKLEKYQSDFETKVNEFCRRLAEVGEEVLSVKYSEALYAGDNDVEVSVEPGEGCATLVANGKALAFIEFGTGIRNKPQGEYASQVEGVAPLGTYGKGMAGESTGGVWIYRGSPGNAGHELPGGAIRTKGNPAANAFPAAYNEMSQQLTEIAREVFAK